MFRERGAHQPEGPAVSPAGLVAGTMARPPRVLVLNDSAAQRKMLITLLRRLGFEAVACGDAQAALEIARDPDIGLIVSDWMMPGMKGPEFCRRLRATGRDGYQYVILLTSKSDTRDLSEGLDAGADDFLTKPVSAHELRARLDAGARIVRMQAELVDKTRSLGEALTELRSLYTAIDLDLDEARRVQTSFLNETSRRFGAAEVSLWLRASGHVGGDMVGVFEVTPHVFGFYSMDVSGHGVAAGMLVARAAGMLRESAPEQNIALASHGSGVFSAMPPDMVAARMNAQLVAEIGGERYLTMCLAFLDQRTGQVRMVQAGHPHPILLRADGGIERVGDGGMPIGLFAEARYDVHTFLLGPGDRLMFYSDGLTECPVGGGDMLEEAGLVDLCRRHRNLDAGAMLRAISTDLEDMTSGVEFPDDASALLVGFDGPRA